MAPSYNTVWTSKQNKLFEEALAIYDRDTPDRWHNIAKAVGGKTVEDVKRQYKILEDDVNRIESGKVPFPNYKGTTTTTTTGGSNGKGSYNITKEEQRLKCLKLQ